MPTEVRSGLLPKFSDAEYARRQNAGYDMSLGKQAGPLLGSKQDLKRREMLMTPKSYPGEPDTSKAPPEMLAPRRRGSA